ncbi:uncharacterized protein LOC103316968 [Nasonia vitripennis]|uniref:THAP-type domain-containing protein n=1 Tax=Nasonia vitripennis TaxID=7425 RepID=A0A7M7H8D1_NASVI|nr:uncharacterized protein LOC103316968 [Nasonia vitripennis]
MPKSREYCCVQGCNSVSGKNSSLTFHKFPKPQKQIVLKTNYFGAVEQVDWLVEWRKALKISTPHPRMRVCFLHFKHDDYVTPDYPGSHRILVKSAVPSLNLPVTPKEKENLSRNEARLNRIIQRSLAHNCSISTIE